MEQPTSASRSEVRLKVLICLLLIAITLIAYWQVFGAKFITSFDDQQYITANPIVARGLSAEGIGWALTTFRASNWHPLTWISHQVDCQLYGLNPLGHHLTNLLFHIASTLLLFLLLSAMTGSVWRSSLVAALFAIHPLHVESVAWIAERKDVLSTCLGLITVYGYVLYARRPSILRYAVVLIVFGLGLLAKPMLVSLPIVLLLLDYWPLDRGNLRWRLLWEKVPLFAMSAASCVITIMAQSSGGATVVLDRVPFAYKMGNSAVSYVAYIVKMIWPSGLAAFYPHPEKGMPMWEAVGAVALLVAATALAIRYRCRRPYLTVGWLWYLTTLVPVIGIMQVGSQSMADRYSYIPLTGLFIIIAWGLSDFVAERGAAYRRILPASAVLVIAALMICTWVQVGFWRDSYTLFDHAAKVTKNNWLALANRGSALFEQKHDKEAIRDFRRALEIRPDCAEALAGLGTSLIETGHVAQGMNPLLTALSLGYDLPSVRYEIAYGYYSLGKLTPAAEQCGVALQYDPRSLPSHNLLAAIVAKQGKMDEAIEQWKSAVELDPGFADAYGNLALAYYDKGNYGAAWKQTHLYESKGKRLSPEFIAKLTKRMADPDR